MTPASALLEVDDLGVAFATRKGTVQALHDVSFGVAKGETLGVVGESGSGKSVTAMNIMGILDRAGRVTSGRVVFSGIDLTVVPEYELRSMRGREFSMIFQNPRVALNPIRRVGKQIEDVLLRHTATRRRDVRDKAIELLETVRIREPERRYLAYPFELSGGMCQRVMIAIALACEPALLIADEPTTGLDVTTQKTIMDLIAELARARDMATILITHDLGLAAGYCDRIVVMQAGGVVEQADVRTLFAHPSHAYTRKLIAATPTRETELDDLAVVSEDQLASGSSGRSAPLPSNRTLLEVDNLVKEYPVAAGGGFFRRRRAPDQESFRAVDGIGFRVMAGESVGLVGESGCGKSTTSSMITRLLDPTSGSIRFEGEDIARIKAKDFAASPWRAAIQMVFQDPTESLNPRWPALQCIADPIRRLGSKSDRADLATRVGDLANMVGLPRDLLSRYPHQLSGGQKARVGIARAIALHPKLLILDEPTSALDVSVQAVVLRLLDRLRREMGMSYIFVSHDLNVVRLLCSRVLVMNQGKIVEEGPSERLLTVPSHPYTASLIAAIPHLEIAPAAPAAIVEHAAPTAVANAASL
ncbi:MAG: ABC transporter ATP-binding protein [Pseudomonadota bacterium]